MKYHRIIIFAVLIALLSVFFFQPPQPAEAQSGRQVWAYYMGFWTGGPSWDMQAGVLTDRPQMGSYDSRHAGVAAAHIDQAKSAGIDAFVVSWFGVGEGVTTTPALNNLLDRAAERNFSVGAVIDIFNPAFNRNRDEIVASLNYLIRDRANHPAYLRYNGKPVILFAFQNRIGFSNAEWLSIRNQVDPNRTTIWIAEGVNGCCLYGGAMDGMYAFNIAWANGSGSRFLYEKNAVLRNGGSLYLPTVHPGWDEDRIAVRDGRPNPTSRRDRANGQFLTNSWNGAISVNPEIIMIGTWNEFMEGSHIEPSQLYGSQALDILRPLIAAWKGSGAPAAPAPAAGAGTGQQIEATTNVNVRAGPGTANRILGVIRPGTAYAVTGSQSGWYSISYGGQTGWVFGQLVRVSGGSGAAPAGAATGRTLQATTTLNVRSGPGTTNSILGVIRPGTSYAVTGEQGGWYSISYGGQTGWVFGQYTRVSGN